MLQHIKDRLIENLPEFRPRRSIKVANRYKSYLGRLRTYIFVVSIKFELLFVPFTVKHNHYPYDMLLAELDNAQQYAVFYSNTIPLFKLYGNTLSITSSTKLITLKGVTDFIAWENDSSLKSIRSISHMQLIVERVQT